MSGIDQKGLENLKRERAKKRIQQSGYQTIHLEAIIFACLATAVAVFATISFQNWYLWVFWSVVVGGLAVVIVSMLDDVYAYTVVFIALVADAGWSTYILIVEGYYFYRILYAIFDPGYIPPHCDQPYCQGYRADTFYFFYLLLAAQESLTFSMLYAYYQIFTIEDDVNKKRLAPSYANVVPFLRQIDEEKANENKHK